MLERWKRILPVVALAPLLAACGIHLPHDIALYGGTACERFMGKPDDPAENSVFFMSSRQSDCRGDAIGFANFRSREDVAYGESALDPGAKEPWKTPAARLYDHRIWLDRLKARLANGENGGRLLVYVHGFNNDVDVANKDAWYLSQLYFSGVPMVVVHWPSRYRMQSYAFDEDSVQWAQDYLDRLLAELTPMASEVAIVGHSLGTRAVMAAVDRLDEVDPANAGKVTKVVLASPDIDRNQALRSGGVIERLLRDPGRSIVIYASAKDRALKASRGIHGYDRLGSSDCAHDVDYVRRENPARQGCSGAAANPRLAVVETDEVDAKGPVNHSDFVDSCPVRLDLATFLRSDEQRPADYEWRVTGENTGGRVFAKIARAYFEKHPCDS